MTRYIGFSVEIIHRYDNIFWEYGIMLMCTWNMNTENI